MTTTTSMEQCLSWGQDGEEMVARYYVQHGYSVMFSRARHGGAQLIDTPRGKAVSPDILVMSEDSTFWVECKRKDRFEWHRKGGFWYTGVDTRQWRNYLQFATLQQHPLWLAFLHEYTVNRCPTGLFIIPLRILQTCIAGTFTKTTDGLTYWNYDSLAPYAISQPHNHVTQRRLL